MSERKYLRTAAWVLAAGALASSISFVRADESDDLQTTIERERRGAVDLKRLDEQRAASEDIALIDVWLNLAWKLRGEQEFDRAREVLERVDAQKDMVREKITAAAAQAQAAKLEAEVATVRQRIKKLKQEIIESGKKKAALEARTEGKAK